MHVTNAYARARCEAPHHRQFSLIRGRVYRSCNVRQRFTFVNGARWNCEGGEKTPRSRIEDLGFVIDKRTARI